MVDRNETKADRQKAFLQAYALRGTVKAAMDIAGINRRATVGTWRGDPEFLEEMDNAARDFRESLEELAFERVKEQKPSHSPLLLITLLNAHWPDKYRPGNAIDDDKARDMAKQLRRLAGQAKKNPADAETADVVKAAQNIADGHRPE
jgi:hypothetical protein